MKASQVFEAALQIKNADCFMSRNIPVIGKKIDKFPIKITRSGISFRVCTGRNGTGLIYVTIQWRMKQSMARAVAACYDGLK